MAQAVVARVGQLQQVHHALPLARRHQVAMEIGQCMDARRNVENFRMNKVKEDEEV